MKRVPLFSNCHLVLIALKCNIDVLVIRGQSIAHYKTDEDSSYAILRCNLCYPFHKPPLPDNLLLSNGLVAFLPADHSYTILTVLLVTAVYLLDRPHSKTLSHIAVHFPIYRSLIY